MAVALIVGACGGTGPAPSGSAPSVAPGSSAPAPSATAAGAPVEIRWYCCLGTGEDPAQLPIEEQVVADFNASHPGIVLKFEVVTYDAARATLSTQIAAGNGPDIVGPVGVGGAEAFHGQWLDLQPYIDSSGFDLSAFDQGAVDFYKSADGQTGIPFAIYPSMIWYKKSLFEEAGLAEPPHKYGDKYTWPDGRVADWNYDTVKELGLKLTVDKNGKDATEAGFDPESIVQYGFEPQRDDLRGMGAYFGAGALSPDGGNTVTIPDAWADGWKYVYDGMWADKFIMTGPVFESEEFNGDGYAFFSGRVAMSENFLWTTYGVAAAGDDWDFAAIPAHDGTATSPLNADTFRILKSTKNPEAAFEVLSYFLTEASGDLLGIYGGMPANTGDQESFFTTLGQSEGFPDAGRLAGREGQRPVRRQPELRGVHAQVQRVARRADQVQQQVDDHAGPDHGRRDRRVEERAPGRLGLIRPWQAGLRRMTPLARREARQGFLFISPWIFGFLAFTAIPMIATLGFTFLNLTLAQEEPIRFVGLDNYARLVDDDRVWHSLSVTLPVRAAVDAGHDPAAVPAGRGPQQPVRASGASIFRVLFFLPYVVPFVAGVIIWQSMLGDTGWINDALRLVGVADPPSWLFDSGYIYPAW